MYYIRICKCYVSCFGYIGCILTFVTLVGVTMIQDCSSLSGAYIVFRIRWPLAIVKM